MDQEQESAHVFLCQEQRDLAIPSFAFGVSNGEAGEFFSSVTPYHNCLSGEVGSFMVDISDGFRFIRIKELVSLMDTKFSVNVVPFAKALWGYVQKRGMFTPGFEARRGFFVSEAICLSRELFTYFNFENSEKPKINIFIDPVDDHFFYHLHSSKKQADKKNPFHETRSIPFSLRGLKEWKVSDIYQYFPWFFRQMFGKDSFDCLPKLWQTATLDLRGVGSHKHGLVFDPLAVDFSFSFVDPKKNDNHIDINRIQITKIRIYSPNDFAFHSFLVR